MKSKRQLKKDKKSSTSTTLEKEIRAKAKESAGPAGKRATERQNARKARASRTLGTGTGRTAAEVGIKADIRATAKEVRAKAKPAKEGG
jgi:hypothetical protein